MGEVEGQGPRRQRPQGLVMGPRGGWWADTDSGREKRDGDRGSLAERDQREKWEDRWASRGSAGAAATCSPVKGPRLQSFGA